MTYFEIHNKFVVSFGRLEWSIISASVILTMIGIALIYSATASFGAHDKAFVVKQIAWFSLGIVVLAALLIVDYRIFEKYAFWIYLGIIVALIVVWSIGRVTAGSRRWIDLGLMRFQPSEFAKVAVVLALSRLLGEKFGSAPMDLSDLIKPLGIIVLPVALVLVQPDLGTAIVIFLIGVSVVLFAGPSKRVVAWLFAAGISVMVWTYFFSGKLLLDYQKKRIATFLNPDYDPLGSGYHIIQSQIAIGSGGLTGQGFLQGAQNQLMFLPVKHTDFIFTILAEEFGFVGCLLVLGLFATYLFRGLSIAQKARDGFGSLATFGCISIIFWHVTINVGMVMGLLPVVGVPLNFLSYGGSSLLASFTITALVANVSMRRFNYHN
ncbi:MAG: rod shape-determining protein RodA [Desulfomonilaceae bacterium]